MMKFLISTLLLNIIFTGCVNRKAADESDLIKSAIDEQLQVYPESSLQDIYKSFFQDHFGPGHLLQDTAAAWDYFITEMEQMKSKGNYLAEPCGMGQRFVRVPLDLVKDNLIDSATFFKAFVESSKSYSIPDTESWKKDWNNILEIVKGMSIDLQNFEKESKEIDDMLDQGETMVHHSRTYSENYEPHYRVMTIEQWMTILEEIHTPN